MSYDENLAKRVRAALGPLPDLVEKKMFGGVGFMLQGNMACGVNGDDLIVRVGPEKYAESIARSHTKPFDIFSRKPMEGWIMVEPEGCKNDPDLEGWTRLGIDYARSLPPK